MPTPFHTSCVASALHHPDAALATRSSASMPRYCCGEYHSVFMMTFVQEWYLYQQFYCSAADFIGTLFSF
jgi:hypothetical protein